MSRFQLENHRNFNFYQAVWLFILSAFISYLFLSIHQQPQHFQALADAAKGLLDGHPHWMTYQNRLLGPFLVLMLSKFGLSFLTALKVFYVLGIVIQIFLLDALLRRSGCSEIKSFAWVLLYCFLFIIYQYWWFYTWDTLDILIFTVFSYFILNNKPTSYFIVLFFIALLNRESALFIPLFLVVKEIRFHALTKSIGINSIRTFGMGLLLFVLGISWIHCIRSWLFISSPEWILNLHIPQHIFLGNVIQTKNFYTLLFNKAAIKDQLWVFGSLLILGRMIMQLHKEQAYLYGLYFLMLLNLLVFGLVTETRMYMVLFPILIFILASWESVHYDDNVK